MALSVARQGRSAGQILRNLRQTSIRQQHVLAQARTPRSFRNDNDFFHSPASFLLDPWGINSSLLTSNLPTAPTAKNIALDVIEKPDFFEVKGDLPGIKEENVKLSVDGDVLTISVEDLGKEIDEVKEEGGVKVHRIERSSAFVRRVIRLPVSAETGNIAADMSHGVLTVHIPKLEKAPRQRVIAIGKGGSKTITEKAHSSKTTTEKDNGSKTTADKVDGSKAVTDQAHIRKNLEVCL